MSKPLLSIIIPVAPNRCERLKAILSRLSLNKRLFPDHTFEVVVVDGGATDETKDLCEFMAQYMPLKYVYVPICRFVNAGYPRNIALRLCEGTAAIGMIDIDHWPSEHIVYGMLNPFVDDSDFRVIQITEECDKEFKLKDVVDQAPGLINGQYTEGVHNVLNRGYVVDSSKSHLRMPKESLPAQLLDQQAMGLQILSVYEQAKIPFGVNNTMWIWSAPRAAVTALKGYDEIYCRKFAYSREDDSWRIRLRGQITGVKDLGVQGNFFDKQNKNFCAIHLWHPASWRGQDENQLNKKYFDKTYSRPEQAPLERNVDWDWGKLLDYSFSVIGGEIRDPVETEQWIKSNIGDVPNYVDNPTWGDIGVFMKELEVYVAKRS